MRVQSAQARALGGLSGSRENLVSLMSIPLGPDRAKQFVVDLESVVGEAAKKSATKVVVIGIVASSLIAFFMARKR